jgi:hypothetical protein
MAEQIDHARREHGEGELDKLLHAGDTWKI